MFLIKKNSCHYFGNVLCFSSYLHHSTILQPETRNSRPPVSNPIKLCDNLKNRMFLQNFFSWPYFVNLLVFSSYPHHSTIPQPNNFIWDCRIRLLGQKRIFTDKTWCGSLEKTNKFPKEGQEKKLWRNILLFKLSHCIIGLDMGG
jgi:hypothetical protein